MSTQPRTTACHRLRANRLCWMLAAASGCGGPARSPARDIRAADGAGPAWTAPAVVAGPAGNPVYVERPGWVTGPTGTLLIGSPTMIWTSRHLPFTLHRPRPDSIFAPGVVIGRDGIVRLLPPLGTPPVRPTDARATADVDGRSLVLWAEHPRDSDPASPVVALWSAEFDGVRWSVPDRIVPGPMAWNTKSPSALVWRGDTLHLVVPSRYAGDRLLHIRRIARRWRVDTLAPRAAYAALAATRSGRLVLVHVGTDAALRHDHNSLFVSRSDDAGETWSPPSSLRHSDGDGAFEPLLFARGDSLLLVWRRALVAAGAPDSISVARSTDRGATWRPLASLPVPSRSTGLDAVMDTRGTLHVALVTPESGRNLFYARLCGETWRDASTLAFGESETEPSLLLGPRDAVWMLWGVAPGIGKFVVPELLRSTREASGCADAR